MHRHTGKDENGEYTSFRERIIGAFEDEGVTVVSYGQIAFDTEFVMVRPAGVLDDREQVTVIAANPIAAHMPDRDEGLAEFANRVHTVLRNVGVSVYGSETVDYDPMGGRTDGSSSGGQRTCILFSVSSLYRGVA